MQCDSSDLVCNVCGQDDSSLNRKIIRRILEGEAKTFSNAVIEEADDGTSAVTAVQSALDAGLTFDFIFMDFVMVSRIGFFGLSHSNHAALFQVKMNGPEAVKILRNSLKFRHTIIGKQCDPILSHSPCYVHISKISLTMGLFFFRRRHGQCATG